MARPGLFAGPNAPFAALSVSEARYRKIFSLLAKKISNFRKIFTKENLTIFIIGSSTIQQNAL